MVIIIYAAFTCGITRTVGCSSSRGGVATIIAAGHVITVLVTMVMVTVVMVVMVMVMMVTTVTVRRMLGT